MAAELSRNYKEIPFEAPWGVIAAKAWGPDDGKPFLGLHGWLDNANTFDKLVHLLPENIRFVAIDFPGHGQSSHRWPGMPYLLFEYVADVKKVVSQLGWGRFSIIAHSMGASVASLYAGCFPNEVDSLVLIDFMGAPIKNQHKPALELARYATKMSDMNPVVPHAFESVESVATRRVQPLFAGLALRIEDALLLMERGTSVTKDGVIFSHDPALKSLIFPFVVPQSSLKLILSKIQCAVLVLEGTDSYSVHVQHGREERKERLSIIYQHAKFKMWKNVQGGHYLHLDNPEQIAQEIKQFLALCHDLHRSKL